MAVSATPLARSIDAAVAPLGFKELHVEPASSGLPWIAAWKRKTWNTNRGIACLELPASVVHPGEYALDIRARAGKAIGYLPFLYELGLQLVLVGPDLVKKARDLERYVTKINNSTVLLQSIHVVDLDAGVSHSVRTWGQVVTGRLIDALEAGIAGCLGPRNS